MKATTAYEHARTEVKSFINARSREEIIFTSGATHAINIGKNSFLKIKIFRLSDIVIF